MKWEQTLQKSFDWTSWQHLLNEERLNERHESERILNLDSFRKIFERVQAPLNDHERWTCSYSWGVSKKRIEVLVYNYWGGRRIQIQMRKAEEEDESFTVGCYVALEGI